MTNTHANRSTTDSMNTFSPAICLSLYLIVIRGLISLFNSSLLSASFCSASSSSVSFLRTSYYSCVKRESLKSHWEDIVETILSRLDETKEPLMRDEKGVDSYFINRSYSEADSALISWDPKCSLTSSSPSSYSGIIVNSEICLIFTFPTLLLFVRSADMLSAFSLFFSSRSFLVLS